MVIKTIIENWKEARRSDLRRSVKPFFRGDRSHYSSYLSGAETHLKIEHNGILIEFWSELKQFGVFINCVDALESPLLTDVAKKELERLLSSEELLISERNRRIARLIKDNLH